MKTLLLLLILAPLNVNADDWFCSTQTAQKRGNDYIVCGTGSSVEDRRAREFALDNAISIFKDICRESADCNHYKINVAGVKDMP